VGNHPGLPGPHALDPTRPIAGLLSLILGGAGALSIDRLLARKGGLSERPKEHQHAA